MARKHVVFATFLITAGLVAIVVCLARRKDTRAISPGEVVRLHHESRPLCASVSEDAKTIAVGLLLDGSWDRPPWRQSSTAIVMWERDPVRAKGQGGQFAIASALDVDGLSSANGIVKIALSGDGETAIACLASFGLARIVKRTQWTRDSVLKTGRQCYPVCTPMTVQVFSRGELAAVGTRGGRLDFYEFVGSGRRDLRLRKSVQLGVGAITCIDISPDDAYVLAGDSEGQIVLGQCDPASLLWTRQVSGAKEGVSQLAGLWDHNAAIAVAYSGRVETIRLGDGPSMLDAGRLSPLENSRLSAIARSRDGDELAAIFESGDIVYWSVTGAGLIVKHSLAGAFPPVITSLGPVPMKMQVSERGILVVTGGEVFWWEF